MCMKMPTNNNMCYRIISLMKGRWVLAAAAYIPKFIGHCSHTFIRINNSNLFKFFSKCKLKSSP